MSVIVRPMEPLQRFRLCIAVGSFVRDLVPVIGQFCTFPLQWAPLLGNVRLKPELGLVSSQVALHAAIFQRKMLLIKTSLSIKSNNSGNTHQTH